jgi:hypothetical protein
MSDPLRAHLERLLNWDEAHVTFDAAVDGLPPHLRGAIPSGFEHSPWQLIEHLRIAQRDLLDFSTNADYVHNRTWPDDYWPKAAAPPDDAAWDEAIALFRLDRQALQALVMKPAFDLFAPVPTGQAHQTGFRSILLVVDHNAYHVGQLIAVRKALGAWR